MSAAGHERYTRQNVLAEIGPEGQEKLLSSSVLIIGCGALGSVQAGLLARAGVGTIRIADRDVLEMNNLQRQVLFDEEDVAAALPKAEAAARKLRAINSTIEVEGLVLDVTPRNVEALIEEVALVLDGTDNFETRYLINDACIKLGKPWIYGGVIGTRGLSMVIRPGETPCLRCLFPHSPQPGILPTCETHGVLNTVPSIIASFQVTEALRILTECRRKENRLLSMDIWECAFRFLEVRMNGDCPCCGHGRFEFLDANQVVWAASMCGRDAVQVHPARPTEISLEILRDQLKKVGLATSNGLLLWFEAGGYKMMIFPDGRMIIKGTSDESLAKSLYARYLGT